MAWFNHTPETDAVIRAGYAANRKVSIIAAELGVSRNTIIGRARRIGLADRSNLIAALSRPEVSAGRSEKMKERWATDSDYAANTLSALFDGRKKRWADQDLRDKHSVAMKAAWQRRRQTAAAGAA